MITKGGFITEEHRADGGQGTWVLMEDGRKLWLWYPMPKEFGHDRAVEVLTKCSLYATLARHKPDANLGDLERHVFGVLLQPGDMM
jgi:hypothetical protein